jgi:CubicO group peptidase (beta-lactamase class C family)
VDPRRPNPIPLGDYAYTVEVADRRIHQMMKRYQLPSAAVALIDDQDVIWEEAFGLANVEEEVPATADTVYRLLSVSKVFTAIETMRLVEEGLVDLDAPITDYLPDFSIQSRFPASGPITVRSILAHHSGLPRNECYALTSSPEDDDVLRETVDALKTCHQAFPVGYRYKYSNVGPDTLGYLIEKMRGESFAGYMKKSLLSPIGMNQSAFLSAEIPQGAMVARSYEYHKGEYYPRELGDITSLPSSNLYATLEDMSAFVRFVLRGGEAKGEPIIGLETLELMFEDQYSTPRDPEPMGLGWKTARVLGSELLVWHDGGPDDGTGSLVALLPERKLGVVMVANATSFGTNVSLPLAIHLLGLMLETKVGLSPPEARTTEPVEVEAWQLDNYAGRYIAFRDVMSVSRRGARLKGTISGMSFTLTPVSETRFRVTHWLLRFGVADLLRLPMDLRELEIEFLPGDEAAEDLMIIHLGDYAHEICPRYPEVAEPPALWRELAGEYDLVKRLPSGRAGGQVFGRDEIRIEDGVLKMPGVVGPLLPISETEMVILSGPFAGETMTYDPGTGSITHQWVVYKPVE